MNASHLPAIDKLCPECGRPLAIRTNTKNHSQFLGCTGYPECSHTEAIPEITAGPAERRLSGVARGKASGAHTTSSRGNPRKNPTS
jgi:ssDNA-binding Zn-finger/Zn-ribbon topoisomerase 1